MIRRFLTLVALVTTAIAVCPTPSALAAAPTRYAFDLSGSDVVSADAAINPCGFPIVFTTTSKAIITQFVNASGEVVRELDVFPHTQLTVTGPSGIPLEARSPALAHVSYGETTVTIVYTGAQMVVPLPGQRTTVLLSGRFVQKVDFTTDPPTFTNDFTGLEAKNADVLCALLG